MSSSSPNQDCLEIGADYLAIRGEGNGHVHRDWKAALSAAGLERVEDFFSATGKALSKPGLGKRYRAQIELSRDGKTVSVFLKRYAGESLRNLLQRWFEDGGRSTIALREVRVAAALAEIGIATFQTLAWGSQGSWGTEQKSFLVMSRVAGESLERWLATERFPATCEGWRKKVQLVEQVAIFARRIHERGWFHRDFYLCHIFIDDSDGSYRLALVDLARMFRPRWRVERWRIKDLAQLDYSAPVGQFSRTMRLRFAKIYLGADRLSPSDKAFLRKVAARSKGISDREQRKGNLPA